MPKLTKNYSVKKAHKTQVCLSRRLISEDRLPQKIKTVGSFDVSYIGNFGIGAITVIDYEKLNLLKTQPAICEVKNLTFQLYCLFEKEDGKNYVN